ASGAAAPSPSGTARTVQAPIASAGQLAVKAPSASVVVRATTLQLALAGSRRSTRTGAFAVPSVALQRTVPPSSPPGVSGATGGGAKAVPPESSASAAAGTTSAAAHASVVANRSLMAF